MLAGIVTLQLGTEMFELATGDSIDYRSSTPHRLDEHRRATSRR